MKRTLAYVAVMAATVALGASQNAAAAPTAAHLSGGGTASISQVAFNVSLDGSGGASGSFVCLMAGRSKSALSGLGLFHIMQVRVTPTAGSLVGSKVTFSGPGELIMDGGPPQQAGIVTVWADVGTQTFQLELASMPEETFVSGGISLR